MGAGSSWAKAALAVGFGLAGLAGSACAASAAALTTGPWTCAKAVTSTNPAEDQAKGSGAGEALVERLQILDASHYVLSSQDEGAAQPSDAGVYTLEGDRMVGRTGPLAQVPTEATLRPDGPGGKPALTFHWASAPTLTMICQPGA